MEDKYYPRLGLSPKQSTTNVDAGSELVAMFAALPEEGATCPPQVRMSLSNVTDETLPEALLKEIPHNMGGSLTDDFQPSAA